MNYTNVCKYFDKNLSEKIINSVLKVKETNLMAVHQRVEYVSNRSASDDGMR